MRAEWRVVITGGGGRAGLGFGMRLEVVECVCMCVWGGGGGVQGVADKAYRSIWNGGKSLAVIRMQQEHVNVPAVRRQLKIETRALE